MDRPLKFLTFAHTPDRADAGSPDEGLEGGGPAGSAGADEYARRLEQSDTEEGGDLEEGTDDPEALRDRIADLEEELQEKDRVIGRQGRELGYARQGGAHGAQGEYREPPQRADAYAQPGRQVRHPMAEAMQQLLTDGDVEAFGRRMDEYLLRGYGYLRGVERTQEVEERGFIRAHPELEEGIARRIFDAQVAQIRQTYPRIPVREAMDRAGEETREIMVEMGYQWQEGAEDAGQAARGAHTPGARGARRGTPGRQPPKTEQQILSEHTAGVLDDLGKASERVRRPLPGAGAGP